MWGQAGPRYAIHVGSRGGAQLVGHEYAINEHQRDVNHVHAKLHEAQDACATGASRGQWHCGTGCGVVGLSTVAAIRAWVLQLISWTRPNWGEAKASAIADINRDSGAQVFAGLVSEEFDIAMHKAMLKLA